MSNSITIRSNVGNLGMPIALPDILFTFTGDEDKNAISKIREAVKASIGIALKTATAESGRIAELFSLAAMHWRIIQTYVESEEFAKCFAPEKEGPEVWYFKDADHPDFDCAIWTGNLTQLHKYPGSDQTKDCRTTLLTPEQYIELGIARHV